MFNSLGRVPSFSQALIKILLSTYASILCPLTSSFTDVNMFNKSLVSQVIMFKCLSSPTQKSEISTLFSGKCTIPSHLIFEASEYNSNDICLSHLHSSFSSLLSKNFQASSSSLSSNVSGTEEPVFRLKDIAKFISFVYSFAPGTTSKNEMHLPANR